MRPPTPPMLNMGFVNDMSGMFDWPDAFNRDFNGWNVAGVKTTEGMFCDALSFHQKLDWGDGILKESR